MSSSLSRTVSLVLIILMGSALAISSSSGQTALPTTVLSYAVGE